MPVNIISIENLTFCYNGIEVLQDISFAVEKGAYLGVAGPNGSGKSTLIKNILGILQPRQGNIYLFGQPLGSFRTWHKIGYLPQRLAVLNTHFPATVREIIQLGAGRKKNLRDINQVLQMMDIEHLSSRMIGELSYGQQQRTMLARALASKPELLIFDEPTIALDPQTRENFYQLTRDLNLQQGTTIILVTHDTGVLGNYARLLLYLDKKVLFLGTFENFCASSEMTGVFGKASQHIICHQHDRSKA
ncbi:MAG: metal ABC transporter ATP-binding protein [Smithella sp.]|nr:metal ABC transporter ATP-binding protein [Syntrophaceae bacterium]NTW76857.1 metal ABC transporter ATP-binding protein [Syntrophaceae bacterium]